MPESMIDIEIKGGFRGNELPGSGKLSPCWLNVSALPAMREHRGCLNASPKTSPRHNGSCSLEGVRQVNIAPGASSRLIPSEGGEAEVALFM